MSYRLSPLQGQPDECSTLPLKMIQLPFELPVLPETLPLLHLLKPVQRIPFLNLEDFLNPVNSFPEGHLCFYLCHLKTS